MNLILLDSDAGLGVFPRQDRRYQHLRKVLKSEVGDTLKAGALNGMIGSIEILKFTDTDILYSFTPLIHPPSPYPLEVILGAMRPIVARRLLKDLTTIGVQRIHLVAAERSERSYLESSLWKKDEYIPFLKQGVEQAGSTILPEVKIHSALHRCISTFSSVRTLAVVLEPQAATPLGLIHSKIAQAKTDNATLVLAVGPERGWSEKEIRFFLEKGFVPCRLGDRILRTESAALIATGILLAEWDCPPVY